MAWVEILPGGAKLFHERGWDTPAPFLDWTGILVNQHRHRQVEEVTLAADRFFIKKQSAVHLPERFHNAWDGFGWCSTAVREAAILQAARDAGIGCPEVVALGEQGRSAFMVTRAETEMTELRHFLQTPIGNDDRLRLAAALGQELSRLHDAGFDHPDLFAKHILVKPTGSTFQFCILDWARARRRRSLSWRTRSRNLAMLEATTHGARG